MKLPQEFEEDMQALLKADYPKYLAALDQPKTSGFRINQTYALPEEFEAECPFAYAPIEGISGCCRLLNADKVGSSLCHHLGLMYAQEPSSMLPATCLQVRPGEAVLDLCAAPGGKSSQILEKNRTGVVVLNEYSRARANVLLSNIERQGFKNAVITSLSPSELAERLPAFFDKILVDAPCSGEGMFRKDPDTINEWNKGLKEFNHNRQLEILEQADKMLKEGGVLVYSTCTFNTRENEETVSEFASRFDYELAPVPEVVQKYTTPGFQVGGNKSLGLARRCFPFGGFGEGQFMAKLIKKSAAIGGNCRKSSKTGYILPKNEEQIAKEWLKETTNAANLPLFKVGGQVYTYPMEPLPLENVVLLGVCVGKVEKDRFTPHHQFFKAFGPQFKRRVELSECQAKAYIHGDELDVGGESGYACVTHHGYVLGGGKVANGRLKNYYPKGLRQGI